MRSPSLPCRDDLFARSRRAPLSAFERRALDAHLGVCGLCQAARAFASLYDGVPDRPDAEDDALIARLADRITGARGAIGHRRRTAALAVAAAAALLIAAGGAAAWVSVHRPPSAVSAGAPRPAVARPPSVSAARAPLIEPPGEALLGDALPGVAPPRHERAAVAPPAARRRAHADPSQPLQPAPIAADLFAAANGARRAHDLRGAVDRYFALERRFPDSEEALVSLVSAGDLLSRLGEPDGALRAFDRYLARRPGGSLASEALFGRARSLQKLGREDDEIAAWRRLLRAFPGSIYEAAGRQRLDELLR